MATGGAAGGSTHTFLVTKPPGTAAPTVLTGAAATAGPGKRSQ